MKMRAFVEIISASDKDQKSRFEWDDVSTLLLPEVGDSVAKDQRKPRKVTHRSFNYNVDPGDNWVEINVYVE